MLEVGLFWVTGGPCETLGLDGGGSPGVVRVVGDNGDCDTTGEDEVGVGGLLVCLVNLLALSFAPLALAAERGEPRTEDVL